MSSAGVRSRARVGRWRADGSVAFFVPIPDGTPASAEFARRCLSVLAEQGFQRVITSAVSPPEQAGLLQAGFEVHEHLHLLVLPRGGRAAAGARRARAGTGPAPCARAAC